MTLLESFEQGKILGFGMPSRVIDTILSKVFLFGDRVVKLYKHEKAFYGDLTDADFRKAFYAEDFYWNHFMSPEVYQKLVAVTLDGTEDFYIEMAYVDGHQSLTTLLPAGKIDKRMMMKCIEELVKKLRSISVEHRVKLEPLFSRGVLSLHLESLEDLRAFACMAEAYIPRHDADRMVDMLIERSKSDPYFSDNTRHHVSAAIDNNPDNILVINESVHFMDIMPPKENWRVADEYLTIARHVVDAFVLGGEDFGKSVHKECGKYREKISDTAMWIYEIRSGMIQWAYRHMLGQHDLAEKYREFTEKRVLELQGIKNSV